MLILKTWESKKTGRKNLYGNDLKMAEREQQKIADCFSIFDDLIDDQSRKIKALNLQKKGLMQRLFVYL